MVVTAALNLYLSKVKSSKLRGSSTVEVTPVEATNWLKFFFGVWNEFLIIKKKGSNELAFVMGKTTFINR